MPKQCEHEGCSNPIWSRATMRCKVHQSNNYSAKKNEGNKLKKSPLKKISDKRKKQEAAYSVLRKQFLKDNPNCEICGGVATEIHHKFHREGERLNDTSYFMAVDRKCHRMIHDNPEDSYRLGYLMKG